MGGGSCGVRLRPAKQAARQLAAPGPLQRALAQVCPWKVPLVVAIVVPVRAVKRCGKNQYLLENI